MFAAINFLSIFFTGLAYAAAPVLNCTPDQDAADFQLQLERLAPDMLRAKGHALAPNPSYSVALRHYNGGLVLEFLKPASGMHAMMIANLEINQTLTVPPLALPIAVRVEKPFNWGPNLFVCE